MNFGKKIELFLVNGDPTGLRTAKIVNWSGVAFAAYRSDIGDFLNREELHENPGVYFLMGINEEFENTVYIGETENIAKRIKDHLSKEYWNQCIAFISGAGDLNKAHVRWLEGSIYKDLEDAGQVVLMNNNIPSKTPLSEADEAVMEEFKSKVYLILGTLGFTGINKPVRERYGEKALTDYTFELSRQNKILAEMNPTTTGYKVLKGAKLKPDDEKYKNTSSLKLHYNRREKLREKGLLENQNNENEILKEDQIFQSPSGASQFILGHTSNGRTNWKTKDGKTLKEIEEVLSEKN